MSILEHIRDLRKSILWALVSIVVGFVVVLYFFDSVIVFLYTPLLPLAGNGTVSENVSSLNDTLFITNLLEGFTTKIGISLFGGVIIALPVIVYALLRFIFPALTKRERSTVLIALIFCSLFAFVGFYYGYVVILPFAVKFLTGAGFIPEDVGVLLNYKESVYFIFKFVLIMLLVFQFPVILCVLMALKILDRKQLLHASRYVIVGIFLVCAILTPPDIFSQISVALPLISLYYVSILVAYIFHFGIDPTQESKAKTNNDKKDEVNIKKIQKDDE
ncbi:MAG: twin arginine-targeting protein translocase TatC [Treponema sp. CETP13]|nr:MAG: twin arginine-targeting protein translocase TatC [Treponema sp. CETP13]